MEFPGIYTQPDDFVATDAAPYWGYMDIGAIRSFNVLRDNLTVRTSIWVVSAEITSTNTVTVTFNKKISGVLGYHAVSTNYFGDEINLCNSYGIPAGSTVVFP